MARATLPNGAAGAALFYAHLSRLHDREENARRAARFLDDAMEAVAAVPMRAGLHGGFTGVGWVAEHLGGWCLEGEEGIDPLESLDAALLRNLDAPTLSCDYDLISGLVGFGVFALERTPRPAARRCIERVVHHLALMSEETPSFIRWRTAPEHLPPRDREFFKDGYYVLGVAHGVAAVIVFLAGAVACGVAEEHSRRLLDGAVRFLLSLDVAGQPLPYWIGPSVPITPSRSAWCHGDPGIAAALLTAARGVGAEQLEREAVKIAKRAVKRPAEETGVDEPGLCHGAAGLAHLWNRVYQATGDPEFLAGARYWFERTLAMVNSMDADQQTRAGAEPVSQGFLMGKAGIGLALLSAVAPLEPTWDRVLCLSLPSLRNGDPVVRS